MRSDGNIQRILIVGGGTAGWMAANYLNRFLRRTSCKICLLESPNIGTVGVGEATIPAIVRFIRNMEFDEAEFMRRCHATYKLGIKFVDWVRQGHSYWHPFGVCGGIIDGQDLFHFWLKSARKNLGDGTYSSYSLQALLADAARAPRSLEGSSQIIESGAYAYHLDADALAKYLREKAVGAGVEHIEDDVCDTLVDNDGFIESVNTSGGRELSADLYLDCTGFKAQLIERALGDEYVDWSDLLLCDRAVVLPLPQDPQMLPYTRATALRAGWAWQIPLTHRTGCGYAYSSSHIDDDAAVTELLEHSNLGGFLAEEPRRLEMRVGRRKNFWKGNCIALGLASGFIEPLESTAIFFIQYAIEMLMDYFPDKMFPEHLATKYNRRMVDAFEQVRDFVLLHYKLSQREDTDFWRDSRGIAEPDSLRAVSELYADCGIVESTIFPQTSYYHIFIGGEKLPRRTLPLADSSDLSEVRKIMSSIKAKNREVVKSLPSHRAIIEWLNRPAL
ncbi:MAG: tryptophan 7-halogenase [Planctomycetaceae bacterium]|nr:tryptophan 7-halogenase [Planctomycetales bacterium]MCB9924120.1 tryptophan 7-halogenase [Planctomycetaceae bacterium]